MRVYKDRLYFIRSRRGISGFQEWGRYDYGIASGATVKARFAPEDIGLHEHQGNLNAGERFRLDDGHLPEYQPRATFGKAGDWGMEQPGRIAWIVPEQTPGDGQREGACLTTGPRCT